ncbi:MAG: DUF4474 domain-containing protein [Ruminococcaceae bacterium]|nr:DUF4474 domain-containing protein [Oscillospiraceae bacterium]
MCGIKYNGISYFFCKNIQGDVISIIDIYVDTVVRYSYDAWGKCRKTFDNTITFIGDINPFRYRNYYYDRETDLYYIQSRYYDPNTGRFISPDTQIGANNDITTYNLYTYCGNLPVCRYDIKGLKYEHFTNAFNSFLVWGDDQIEKISAKSQNIVNWSYNGLKDLVRNSLDIGNQMLLDRGVDTAGIGAYLLDMQKAGDIYYAVNDCWQSNFGYCNFYDIVFDIGTYMRFRKFEFKSRGENYVLWAWKGDYINLGAGAELGIYYGGGPLWKIDKDLSMYMAMRLKYKGKQIAFRFTYTWWMTGFNSSYLNVDPDKFVVRFKDQAMFNNCKYNVEKHYRNNSQKKVECWFVPKSKLVHICF